MFFCVRSAYVERREDQNAVWFDILNTSGIFCYMMNTEVLGRRFADFKSRFSQLFGGNNVRVCLFL